MSEIIYEEGFRHRGNGLDGVAAVFETPTIPGFAIEAAYVQIKMQVLDNTGSSLYVSPSVIKKCEVYVGDLMVSNLDSLGLQMFGAHGPIQRYDLYDVTDVQSWVLPLPWPKLNPNNHDSGQTHKVRYQLTYNQTMFATVGNQHIYTNNTTKILWLEDTTWFKMRPTLTLRMPYMELALEGWFAFTYQIRTPTGASQIEDALVVPLSADMRLRGLDILCSPLKLISVNVLLNGSNVSFRDCPPEILSRESTMGLTRFDKKSSENINYITVCDAVGPKNELILTKANDKIRLQVEFGVDQASTHRQATTSIQVLARINYHI